MEGRITEITVAKTVQEGQFEPLKVEITSTVGDKEDPEQVYKYLKEFADYLLVGDKN